MRLLNSCLKHLKNNLMWKCGMKWQVLEPKSYFLQLFSIQRGTNAVFDLHLRCQVQSNRPMPLRYQYNDVYNFSPDKVNSK